MGAQRRTSRRTATLGCALAGLGLLIFQLSCADDPAAVPTAADDPTSLVSGEKASGDGAAAQPAIFSSLPFTGTVNSTVPGFEIKQSGGGISGRFEITNPFSSAIALDGVSSGAGHAILGWNLGRGRAAVFLTSNPSNVLPTIEVSSQGNAPAAVMTTANTASTFPTLQATTRGRAAVLSLNHAGTAGNIALFQEQGRTKARITRSGKGIFNGGTQTGGADVAEAFEVEDRDDGYEPGDVLVISTRSDRRLELADGAYSSRVAGVYATRPGVLLTGRDVDDDLEGTVPVGIVGVLPTKVSAEGGAIRRGDLLVTARTPGHAMRGRERERLPGAVLGKALGEFRGPGTGVIEVLVNVQ